MKSLPTRFPLLVRDRFLTVQSFDHEKVWMPLVSTNLVFFQFTAYLVSKARFSIADIVDFCM